MTRMQTVLARLNRRKDDAERGFSLIELIIVIVIIGILVAIAIPVYSNIQNNAKTNAVKAAAANGASQATASLANGDSVATATTNLAKLTTSDITVSFKTTPTTTAGGSDVCVTAVNKNDSSITAQAGPGC